MKQTPPPSEHLLRWQGDELVVELDLGRPRKGRAAFRTNLGAAAVQRREIVEETEAGATPLAKAWRDVKMKEVAPGRFRCAVPLDEVGLFLGKACFFPEGGGAPEWPEGDNVSVKVEPSESRAGNAIYTVFPRQFGSFREVARRLDHVMGRMGFNVVQTLPPFPVPTTYAVMGEYGCPFAATDFFSVDPACAEFDVRATPLDQFRELIGAVHARGGRLFIDLPANHTGWASTLQTHHPEWFKRRPDGEFVSPGAWGVTWADLVELDYAHPELRAYVADVFLFWARNGVDGFRCDAGYMIPEATWRYVVARVREEYPDTVFMLEGLGGKLETTDALLGRAGLDWAYSEIFQTYDRAQFEWYLPKANARAAKFGTLVHFAETHDNDRLAKGGKTYARLRVALAALLSHQGAWGVANGVEWFAEEKIDVHGKNDLNWGASENMVDLIAKLNALLAGHPAFAGAVDQELVARGGGNFLAVARLVEGAPESALLVLANLDCNRGVRVHWDASRFPEGPAFDVLAERSVDLRQGMALGPGEFLCVGRGSEKPRLAPAVRRRENAARPHVTWRYPEDLHRDVCVPAGLALRVVAPCAFRVRVQDGARTLAVKRGDREAVLELPPYAGDGTRADVRTIVFSAYAETGVRRGESRLFLLPPAPQARVALTVPGAVARRERELRCVLAHGAGAAAFLPVRWGEIRSQYDALFAANPNPRAPGDRRVLWTRCRAWLQHEGYSRELNADCLESFSADPAGRFGEWVFRVPCGMGRETRISFALSLARGANAARLSVRRMAAGGRELRAPVRLVLRPDFECRSFHESTKAFAGPEAAIERRIADEIRLEVAGGDYHAEGQWIYAVAHPDEAERGQEPCGDLFSPGWCAVDLAADGEAALTCVATRCGGGDAALDFPAPPKTPRAFASVPDALREALDLYVARRDDVKTVIAGYPWFLDWGRDTFIFLRGAIAAGKVEDALAIVEAFARFEENGTLPNVIHGDTAGNRDTTDAQLWFTLAVRDLCGALGERKVLGRKVKGGRTIRAVVDSILDRYWSGTPNGIRADRDSALVWSPSHFTWMDTNYPACTPRCGYPVEIQALWIAALRFAGRGALAEKAAASLVEFFANGRGLADCLDAPNGERAADARRDDSLRPNQLFAVTLGAVEDPALVREILENAERLLVPGGVRSLDSADPKYRGVYAGDEDSARKPAYHNGTAWAWPMPLFAEAAAKSGHWPKAAAMSLLAGAVDAINGGCLGHLPEIADGDAPHAQKGCRAQAWSDSEFLRVWLALEKRGAFL
ncbi:MAG: glycogen debranching enzyme N-terminal domain-containing protein [Kiritimatiellae bacterium]|nr:glycogen debranching enzyme N-terminal domain-containing protein [Kiritimatiellia bacterium]